MGRSNFFPPGDWDSGGFSDEIFSISTSDGGQTWTDATVLVATGKESAQNFMSLSPKTGELIIFYKKLGPPARETWIVRSQDAQTD